GTAIWPGFLRYGNLAARTCHRQPSRPRRIGVAGDGSVESGHFVPPAHLLRPRDPLNISEGFRSPPCRLDRPTDDGFFPRHLRVPIRGIEESVVYEAFTFQAKSAMKRYSHAWTRLGGRGPSRTDHGSDEICRDSPQTILGIFLIHVGAALE